ncbi:lytic murein transglycosylase B [Teredinibacter sp. KSP-S5-2]|nr:lytic murein transglycosylase B [Teredinibacter sp. KSP-S5-2]
MTFSALLLSSVIAQADYSKHELAEPFVESMVKEHGFQADFVRSVLAKAEKKQSILDAISRPAEKTKEWKDYRKIFLDNQRINQGVKFWKENAQAIDKAAQEYGVSPEIIVSIIGVETRYGRLAGRYRVVDALSTLAFDYPKRSAFFTKELKNFFILIKEQELDPTSLYGSYAGAMGYGQFMPSSFLAYAVDFDGDNKKDIWQNPTDAIGSVANYFKRHGWQPEGPVATRVRVTDNYDQKLVNQGGRPSLTIVEAKSLGFTPVVKGLDTSLAVMPLRYQGVHGTEFWLGFDNFYVITRYNRSRLYAMAVWQLAEEIKEKYIQ